MEKQGVIKPGLTPPENEEQKTAPQQKAAAVKDLDSDFRKRAADAAASK